MSVLVLVEHDGKSVKDATLAAVTAAAKLGEVHALVAGNNVDGVAQAAAKVAGVGIVADDKRVDVAELRSGGHRCQRRVLDAAAVMLDQNQNAHFAIPIPLSFSTSSSTLPTLIPAWRLAGSTTFSVSRRRATSMP